MTLSNLEPGTSDLELDSDRPRARDLGIRIGSLPTGRLNGLVDVPGVKVGHVSLVEGDGPLVQGEGPIRTGVTAILPHGGNPCQEKVCGAVHVINAFGKAVGLPQVVELGCIETPIMLTNTLNVWSVADATVDWVAERNPGVYSFNPVVGECNDSSLNDILGRHVKRSHVFEALSTASEEDVREGNVGAGVGMTGFGWKGGIGTASRTVACGSGSFAVGAKVLTNTGSAAELRIDGVRIGDRLRPDPQERVEGSIIIVIGTDAPLSARQLGRVARRGAFGLARTGATASHGSGDFVIAFTTGSRISAGGKQSTNPEGLLPEPELSGLFGGAIEAVDEAIVNSLLRAETLVGRDGMVRQAIPLAGVRDITKRHGRLFSN